jgi:hypothetical protein
MAERITAARPAVPSAFGAHLFVAGERRKPDICCVDAVSLFNPQNASSHTFTHCEAWRH